MHLNSTLQNPHEQRSAKEAMLKQHARVFWMCGLSGAGKTTLAVKLEQMLTGRGYLSQVLDGDVLRNGINRGLGFNEDDRRENIRRVAELADLFLAGGIITIVSFISPTIASRQMAKEIIGEDDFLEIFVNAPLDVCENRDIKGLYKKARQGLIPNFTGIDSSFEMPGHPDFEIKTNLLGIEESASALLNFVLPYIEYKG